VTEERDGIDAVEELGPELPRCNNRAAEIGGLNSTGIAETVRVGAMRQMDLSQPLHRSHRRVDWS